MGTVVYGPGMEAGETAADRAGDAAPARVRQLGDRRALGRATGGRPPNIFTTLGRHRGLFRRWLWFAGGLMPGGKLPRADSELVILRVAHNTGCEYEWGHHERLGRRAGLTPEEIERVRSGPGAEGWSRASGCSCAPPTRCTPKGGSATRSGPSWPPSSTRCC